MNPIFAANCAAIFNGPLAVDAVYTPAGGSPVDIRVIPAFADVGTRFGAGSYTRASAMFLVQIASVAAPAEDDVITVGSDSFTVQGVPERDERHLRWRIEARPQ